MFIFDKIISLYSVISGTVDPSNRYIAGELQVPIIDSFGAIQTRLIAGSVTPTYLDGDNNNSDNKAVTITARLLPVSSYNYVFDGVNWDRAYSILDNADAQAALGIGTQGIVSRLQAWNGTTFDRLRSISAAVQASFAAHVGIQAVAMAGNWSIQHDPAVNVQATISRAAGGAGIRHICTSIHGTLSAGGTAGAAVKVYLRDGAAGVGAILWSGSLAVATGGTANLALSGLSIVGSANTAMTLEFAAAGGLTTFENVSLTGYTVA